MPHARVTRALVWALVALAAFWGAASRAGAASLYAVDFQDGLYQVDAMTGELSLVGEIEGFTSLIGSFGLTDRGGELWMFAPTVDRFLRLDPATADVLEQVPIPTDMTGEGAIALRADGTGVVMAAFGAGSILATVDLDAADSSLVGSTLAFDGLDYAPDGTLYGLSQSPAATATPTLYSIDPSDGSVTLVGVTDLPGLPADNLAGLSFRSDGTLWAVWNGSFFRLDPDTAETTLVGPTNLGGSPVTNLSGLTWIPEPGVTPLLAGALALATAAGRRRMPRGPAGRIGVRSSR
ncbi:MAG: hypothetical protein ACQGVK_22845 [Myxococcota bacterium]